MDNHSTEVESQGNDYITLASRMSHIDTRLDEVKESTDSRMRKLTICLDKALKKIDGMETRLEEAEKLKEKVADLEARLAEFTEIYGDPTADSSVRHEMATSPMKPEAKRAKPAAPAWLQDSPPTTPATSPEPDELEVRAQLMGPATNICGTSPMGEPGSSPSHSRGSTLASTSQGSLSKSPSGKLSFKRPSLVNTEAAFKQPGLLPATGSSASRMVTLERELDDALAGMIGGSPVRPSQPTQPNKVSQNHKPMPSPLLPSDNSLPTPSTPSQDISLGRRISSVNSDGTQKSIVAIASMSSSTIPPAPNQASTEATITASSGMALPTPAQTRSPVSLPRTSLAPLSPLSDPDDIKLDPGENITIASASAKRQAPNTEGVKKKKRRIGEGELRYSRVPRISSSSSGHVVRASSVSSTASSRQRKSRSSSSGVVWPDLFSGSEEHDKTLVECDACTNWYHLGCVGVTLDDPRLEESAAFFCPPCATGDIRAASKSRFRSDTCARPACRYPIKDKNGYFIEAIVGRKLNEGILRYLIKWEGYPFSQTTWEPENAIPDRSHVKRFEDRMLDEQISVEPDQMVLLNVARAAGCWEGMWK